MIIDRDIILGISIPPHKLSEDIDAEIKNRVNSILLKREIEKLGVVLNINKIKNISGGKIEFSCLSKFNVCCNIKVYQLSLDEIVVGNVKEITSHGYFVDQPIELFIVTDSKPKCKIGDRVKTKITSIKFNNGKYIVIAKEIKNDSLTC